MRKVNINEFIYEYLILGSPFTFVVGPLFSISGGQNDIKVSGSGLTGGFVGVPGKQIGTFKCH